MAQFVHSTPAAQLRLAHAGSAVGPVIVALLLQERRIAAAVLDGLSDRLNGYVVVARNFISRHWLWPDGRAEKRLRAQVAPLDEILLIGGPRARRQMNLGSRISHSGSPRI